jgi:hypothetical protein
VNHKRFKSPNLSPDRHSGRRECSRGIVRMFPSELLLGHAVWYALRIFVFRAHPLACLPHWTPRNCTRRKVLNAAYVLYLNAKSISVDLYSREFRYCIKILNH